MGDGDSDGGVILNWPAWRAIAAIVRRFSLSAHHPLLLELTMLQSDRWWNGDVMAADSELVGARGAILAKRLVKRCEATVASCCHSRGSHFGTNALGSEQRDIGRWK